MSFLAQLFDRYTQRTPQKIAAAKLEADRAYRERTIGIPYAARRAAALPSARAASLRPQPAAPFSRSGITNAGER